MYRLQIPRPRISSKALVTTALLAVLFLSSFTGALTVVAANSVSQSTVIFSRPVNLSNDASQAHYPMVASVGGNVYVVWTEESHGIYFRSSSDNGATWTPSISLPAKRLSLHGVGTAGYPVISADGSNVYVAWSQSVNKVPQIFFAASTNSGTSFSPAIQLTSGSSVNGFITPVIAAAGSNVYVAYTANGKNSYVVWSNNNGASWNGPFHYAFTHEPQIAAVGNNAYAVADGVQIAVTNNAGATWTIVNNSTGNGDEPWIAVSGSYVYVVSQTKTSTGIIHFFYSNNYGMAGSWTSEPGTDLSGAVSIGDAWEPQITASGNDLYLTFHELKAPNSNWAEVSSNNGKTWSAPIELTSGTKLNGWATGIAVSGSTVATVYPANCVNGQSAPNPNSGPGDCTMEVSYSSDGGQSFYNPANVSLDRTAGPTTDIASSSIAASGSYAYATWQDENLSTSTFQVYFGVTSGQVVNSPSMSIKPVKGIVGKSVTVSGNGFQASAMITIQYDGVAQTTVTSNSSGGFSVPITIPDSTAGTHTISATDGASTLSKNFKVVPHITETPVKAKVGATVSISGSGFSANSQVTITFGGTTLATNPGTISSDGFGSFTASYLVPNMPTGVKYTVTATDANGDSAKTSFAIAS